MTNLELFYPAKPYNITQAFGIKNPSYEQFGFSKHNGIDFAVDTDGIVRAMCDGVVYEVGSNPDAGNFVRYKTRTPVFAEGKKGTVAFMYMHAKNQLVQVGDLITAGDALIVADNTGFSTGPHTHISAYFVNDSNVKLDGDPSVNSCFDHSKYFNGFYSDDVGKVTVILKSLVSSLTLLVKSVMMHQLLFNLMYMNINDFMGITIVGAALSGVIEFIKVKFGPTSGWTKALTVVLAVIIGGVYVFFRDTPVWTTIVGVLTTASAVYALVIK